MRTSVATVVAATLSLSAFSVFAEISLTGAGATFPAPVYAKWRIPTRKKPVTRLTIRYRLLRWRETNYRKHR